MRFNLSSISYNTIIIPSRYSLELLELRQMQKILVTGANSFVGKHLVPFLNSKGYEVQGTARREESLSVPPNRKLTSYRPNLVGDLSDENFLKNVKWKPDIIVHLAANSNLSSNLSTF